MSRWALSPGMVVSLTLLVLFLWGLQAAESGVGRRLPVNIWTWVRAGVGQSQGSRLEELAPLQTWPWETLHALPAHPRTRQWLENPNGCPGRRYHGHSRHLRQRWVLNREACGNPSPKSRAEGGDRGAENREKRGRSSWGTGRERGLLAPIFLMGSGEQSRWWPILPGPLPLRRGHSPSGCS